MIQNNFDFNKLFEKGVHYGRYTDEAYLAKLCYQKVSKTLDTTRTHTCLSKRHQDLLETMMKQIEIFVYDPTSKDSIVFNLQSYALKKALGKRVTEAYMATGIFTEFSRAQPETTIRKTDRFKQANYIAGKKTATTVGDSLGFCDSEEEQKAPVSAPVRKV